MAQPIGGTITAKFIPSTMSLSPEQAQGIIPKRKEDIGIGALARKAGMLALIVVPTFVAGPWAVKQFKPEWKYGKRLIASAAVTAGVGIVRQATK